MFEEAEPSPKQTNMEPNLEPKWAPFGPGKKFILTGCGMLAEAEPAPKQTNLEPNLEPKWEPLGPDRSKVYLNTVWYVCRGRAPPKQTNLELSVHQAA